MSAFTASWLTLREPADLAARDPGLAQRFAAALPPRATILDLGAGTGANARALAAMLRDPHPPGFARHPLPQCGRGAGQARIRGDDDLPISFSSSWPGLSRPSTESDGRPQDVDGRDKPGHDDKVWERGRGADRRWVLVENDPALLAMQPPGFEKVARDLGEGLGELPADGVTAASLLDLAGAAWLEQLAEWVARRGVPLLAVLTVDGRRDYWPADPEDAAVAAAFARDQRRDKGLGPALGPDASGVLAENLARRGFSVSTAASDWRLGPDQAALLAALVQGEAEAAGAPGWGRRRLAQIEAGRLGVRIGHRDLLALPPAH